MCPHTDEARPYGNKPMIPKEPLINSHMVATAAWYRSPGYDLRRTRRDLPDLTRNATRGGVNKRFPKGHRPLFSPKMFSCKSLFTDRRRHGRN